MKVLERRTGRRRALLSDDSPSALSLQPGQLGAGGVEGVEALGHGPQRLGRGLVPGDVLGRAGPPL